MKSWVRGGLLGVLVLGGLSSIRARFPLWAFTEMSLMIMSLALGWGVAVLHERQPRRVDFVLVMVVLGLCGIMAWRFLIAYIAVVTDGLPINPRILMSGFSNIRFYGQFQALSLPLLALPMLDTGGPWHRWRWAAACAGVVGWAGAFAAGSRGLWLSMAVAMIGLSVLGVVGRRWARCQLAMALAGGLLYLLLMSGIPGWLGLEVKYHPRERDLTSLSGRGALWARSVEMVREHPLLGAGPMHFADMPTQGSSHPHQSLLQWAVEWGLPSTLLVLGLLATVGIRTVKTLRTEAADRAGPGMLRWCLGGSMGAAAVLSMVDGVLVMPYTLLWLAILAGWLAGLTLSANPSLPPADTGWKIAWVVCLLVSTGWLVAVAARDGPQLADMKREYRRIYPRSKPHPRFWLQGVLNLEEHRDRVGQRSTRGDDFQSRWPVSNPTGRSDTRYLQPDSIHDRSFRPSPFEYDVTDRAPQGVHR